MSVLDRIRRSRRPRPPRFVALGLSSILVVGMGVMQAAVAAPAAVPADAKPVALPPKKVASRPDVVSAAVTARAHGSRVEVESMRTETTTTWSNPDGTMTTEAHAAPIRYKAGGAWKDIDLTLQKGVDGSVAPRGHEHGLRLGKRNAATGQVFASADSGSGRSVEWISPWTLPEPTLSGTKATYAEVQPGVDLVLDARRDGFENDFIVKQRPVVAPVWRIPLRTKGLTARPQPDGSIQFVDAKSVVRSTVPVGFMWDAVTNPAGDPVHKATVKVTVEQVSPGKATLVVAPNAKWFMDPARVFPVTVDPTYTTGTTLANFDTFVQSDYTSDLSSLPDLRTGKNGTRTERTFLNFSTGPFKGKDVLSASLSIWQYGASSCTPTTVYVRSTLTLASTATRWSNQPALGTVYGQLSAAKGFSSACPGGRIVIPITPLAKAWSNAPYTVGGMALVAANEADVNSWKRFYATGGIADPFISFTWNRPPAVPAKVNPSEALPYRPLGSNFLPALYSPSVRPWVKTKATDPDGNTVKYIYEFHDSATVGANTLKGTCTSSVYASGTEAGCRPGADLPENTQLYVRAKANDGRVDGPWSEWTALAIGSQPAATPTIDCPAPYADNSWQDTAPTADVDCTVSATGNGFSAPGYLRLTVDGKPYSDGSEDTGIPGRIKIRQSSDPAIAKAIVTIPADVAGLHVINAVAETPAGRLSGAAAHSFGWGGSGLTSPAADPRTTTTSTVRVAASGPPRGQAAVPTAHVRWRVSGYGSADDTVGWNEDPAALTVTDRGDGGVSVSTLWDTNTAKTDAFLDSDPDTAGIQPTTLNDRVPVLLDVQVCFTYTSSTQCTWSQTPNSTVQRLPHAFGNGFPTATAGPGQVALWTGEFNTEATDVTVPGYTGDLSISRSHSTYQGPGNNIDGAFGQGWVAQFDGADAGAAGMQVVDSTKVDGTIALVDGDGTSLVFGSPTGKRRTSNIFDAGTWVPADVDTELEGSKLTVSGSGTSTILSYIEDDGTVTTWNPSAPPAAGTSTLFRPVTIAEPGVATKTTYAYDTNGRVVRILAPTAPGVSCAAFDPAKPPLTGLNPGCRALRFAYTTIGATRVRLSEAWLDIYNPDKAGGAAMDSIKVAAYSYDINALLTKVTDPRSNLSTEYTYNGQNHLTSVKPAGQVAYQLNYVTVDQREKLDTVKRDRPSSDPAGGTATLAKFVYDVPLSGAGLPDLSAGAVARWNQKATPAFGFGVFGPDHPLSGAPGADDWQYADLQYTDAAGYTVNTAKYGAGDWQYTSTDYNAIGNVTRELDERALRAVIDGAIPAGGSVDQMSTANTYNADIKNAAGDTVVTPAGTLVTDSYGPARYASVNGGTPRWVRTHTHTEYDEVAPNAGINPATTLPYRLPTTVTTSALDPATGTDEPLNRTLTDYDPAVSGDPSGWALGQPSKTITDANPSGPRNETTGDVVKITRYDSEGRVVDSRQPNSNGADAGTTKTVYYTAAANSAVPECGLKPQWAGLTCKVYPAAAPSTGGTATPSLPTTTTTSYTYLLAPKTVVETSGAVTRTSTTSYLSDGRTQTTNTTVTGLSGSMPNTEKTTTYDAATGQATVVTAKAADNTTTTVTTGYDSWGRQTSYQPQGDSVTTTAYDASGQIATVTDSNGRTRYTYDGTDAAGKTERRGLATKVEVTTAGSTWSSTGAYDADGSMTTQKLPGGITQYTDYDAAEPTGLRYTGQVTTTNEDGSTTNDPDGPWLSWSVDNDVTGRVAHEWTPAGNAFAGPAGEAPGDAIGYDRSYTYDSLGRLTKVEDRTAATTGVDVTDPTQIPGCVTRTYGFDRNDNRLSRSTAGPATDGSCTTTGATTTTRIFDSADRPVTGANGSGTYIYDLLGRTTTIPAADSPDPAGGSITLTYYDNDLARSIAQGGTTTTFTLDALDRRSVETETTTNGSTQTVRHYTDSTDNPTWVTTGTTTQRYAELIGGDLSLTVDQTGQASLPLANTHGDVVTTVELTGTQPATSIGAWCNYDEYGQTNDSASTGPIDYGWLGAKQRATSSGGLTLMGVRLYNAATGLFTSTDPVPGGGANSYAYPTDPVNQLDLSGEWWKPRFRNPWKAFQAVGRVVNRYQSSLVSAGAYVAARATGHRCRKRYGMMVCSGGARIYGRGGTTYGGVYITSGEDWSISRNRITHEKVHRRQWNRGGFGFAIRYLMAGSNPCRNRYEKEAGWRKGGYTQCLKRRRR